MFFEPLETRRHLTANMSGQEPGLLIVFGTLSSDTITVSRLNDGRVRVNENGTLKNFAAGTVTKLWVVGGSGNDNITVSSALSIPTTLQGGNGNDTITGGAGSDTISGESGNDVLNGRGGSDRMYGDAGNDLMHGGSGHDTMYGHAGKDSLYGESGNDYMDGGDNNDLLVSVGGGTSDRVLGGSGTDNFWVDAESTEQVTSGSGERSLGMVHRISKFKDARVVRGFLNETTTPISRNLNGQNLPDPISENSFANFSDNPLFSSNGPRLTDVQQNQLGDCYFLATLASVAKSKPAFLQRHVVDLGDGTYAVRFKGLFGEEYVRVDGDLPVSDSDGNLPRAGFGAENSIWVAIMEKAFAFFRKNEGTYASIEGGISGDGFSALGISDSFSLLGFDRTGLMNRFKSDLDAGRALTISTHHSAGNDGSPIFPTHVYVIDRVNTNSSGTVTSVRLYNPHGVDFGGEDAGDTNAFDGFITVTPQQIMDNFISFNSAAIA